MKKLLGAVAGLVIAAGSAGAQNIVLNPGFEAGLAPWVQNGWGTTSFDPHAGLFAANNGCVGAGCVNLPSPAFLYQDLVTAPGQSYNLSYWFHDAGTPFELKVFWGGSLVQDFTSPSSPTVYNQFFVNSLVASGTTTRLEFWGRQDPGTNRLDDVSVLASVGAVPEPASLTLLATGLAGVFGAAQRKRRARLTD